MSLELRNISGNYAEIWEKETGAMITGWHFATTPLLGENTETSEFPLSKVIKLKEAGFDSDEIIKLMK